ncbi:hypothetical protein L0F63_005724 [Massospora cicadina]|nr:hypothetical protein L0F63_005724 [Massospora cicadina]
MVKTAKSRTLEIQLMEKEVYMRGTSRDDYSSAQVRGAVKLQLVTNKHALALNLTLVGTIQTNWSHEGRMFRDRIEVLRREWSFDTTACTTGAQFFPFQAVLSGTLPPTSSMRGARVEYWLQARLTRPRLWDVRVGRELKVLRIESPTSQALSDGVYACGNFRDHFDYQLSCPHKAFGPSDQIPVRLQLTAKGIGVEIKSVSYLVKRSTTLSSLRTPISKQKEEVVVIEHRPQQNLKQVDETAELSLSPPKGLWRQQDFVSDTINSLVRVRHEVKVRVAFRDSYGQANHMVLKFSIAVMPIDREKALAGLPTYSKHRNTLLLDTDRLPPSYRSSRCLPPSKPSSTSLPAYDSFHTKRIRRISPRIPARISSLYHSKKPTLLKLAALPLGIRRSIGYA